jgi:hypothetical protein
MAQISTLVVTDGTKEHTFTPSGISGGIAELVERSTNGVLIASNRLTLKVGRSGTNNKCEIHLALPIVQDAVVGGVSRPTVVRTLHADIVLKFPQDSSFSERQAMRNMCESMLRSSTWFADSIESAVLPY